MNVPLEATKRRFVLTLVFSPDLSEVVLLHKLRGPALVRNRTNFPGGGIEPGEDALIAGSREDFEETGLVIPETAWSVLDFRDFGDAELTTLVAVSPDWHLARSCTDEPVFVKPVAEVRAAAAQNPDAYANGFLHLLDAGMKVLAALGHGPVADATLSPRRTLR